MTAASPKQRISNSDSPFRMPLLQTMVSRKSSITNAFVCAIIPVVPPTTDEIAAALDILHIDAGDVRCAYCGDKATEWDHLRPLVWKRRPTGFISEIANLVPACGKCNQSKGNKPWRDWMASKAKLSPTGRGLIGVSERIARLDDYERWRPPTKVNFSEIFGREEWEGYWQLCENVILELESCQQVADSIRTRTAASIAQQYNSGHDNSS